MRRSPLLWIASFGVYAFLYVPLAVVVAFSFNDSKLNAEWVGFTLDWYRKLAGNGEMLHAAANSLLIALVSSALATVLGTMAGIAMHRFRSRLLPFMTLTPVAMPEILLGVSLLIFFITVFGEESLSLLTVIVAHTTFCIGFVAIIVRARLAGMDESIFEAARDLGATPWQTIRFVVLPILLPSLVGVGLFGFTLSYDEFARSLYTAGTFNTLPLEIYGMTTNVTTPVLYALGTVTTGVSFLAIGLAFGVFAILRRRQQRHGSDAGRAA